MEENINNLDISSEKEGNNINNEINQINYEQEIIRAKDNKIRKLKR